MREPGKWEVKFLGGWIDFLKYISHFTRVSDYCRNCVGTVRNCLETVLETVVNYIETVQLLLKSLL